MISLDNLKTTLNAIKCLLNDYMKNKDVPTKLPNPKPLNFTGAVKRSYDGSKALTVEIPYSVQSDWNQNDSAALNYIKNRPFYTGEPVKTVLVEETTVSFADAGGLYIAEFPSTFEATVGDTYTVNWDGTEYECVCSVFNSVPVLGNLSIPGAGSDTGEPFIMLVSNGKGLQIHTKDTSAAHTISISGFIAQNVQIPDKYISDTFRDVIIAGDPRKWSATDWTKYYDLFQGGKLLKINSHAGSNFEGYALSMFYKARVSSQISVITPTGDFFKLSLDSTTNELYWEPIFNLNMLYFRYQKTGYQEEYQRLEVSDGLKFTTKTSAEDPVKRKVVLEGDSVSAFTNDAGYLTSHQDISGKQDKATLEADVSAAGFTKNTGTYSKPTGGIPKTDLANDVQASLGKAETALQEHQSLAAYRTAAEQNIIDNAKQDKLIAGDNITIAADGKTISATGGGSVPKPLTYDYMPEGYPTKTMQATTVVEEQELAFEVGEFDSVATLPNPFEIIEGQTYKVKWDGADYECVGFVIDEEPTLGNAAIYDNFDDTGEPFVISNGEVTTLDTSASHTISIERIEEVITPIAYNFMPAGYPSKSGQNRTLMGEQELAFVSQNNGTYSADLANPLDIVPGKTYTVSWDGTEYDRVALTVHLGQYDFITLGNLSIGIPSDDTGEPFLIIYCPESNPSGFFTRDPSPTHTVSVTELATITPMSEEFIPHMNVSAFTNDAKYLTIATLPKYGGESV